MTWLDMSEQAWKAGRVLQSNRKHRACANRFYYAAFSAVTAELRKHKSNFAYGYEHPPHREIGREIKRMLTNFSKQDRDDLRDAVRRLYDARIDADYHANAPMTSTLTRNAMRDARFVLTSLGVPV